MRGILYLYLNIRTLKVLCVCCCYGIEGNQNIATMKLSLETLILSYL